MINYQDQVEFIRSLFRTPENPDGKFLIGKSYNFSFAKIDNILSSGNFDKSYISVPKKIKEIDNFVIENSMSKRYYKDIAKNIIIRESYGKNIKEKIPFYTPSSIGDFQLRIGSLAYKFDKNGWLNKENLEKAFSILDKKEVKERFSSYDSDGKSVIEQDLKLVQEMKTLMNKPNLTKSDFKELHSKLRDLLRIDDGTGYNIVGKIISASLLENKLNNHREKVYGMLACAGEDLDGLKSEEKQRSLQKIIMLVNNKTENITLRILFDNYLIRIIRSGMLFDLKTTNKISGVNNIDTWLRAIYQPYKPSVVSALARNVVLYDNKTFRDDIYYYLEQIKDKGLKNQSDKDILELLENLVNSKNGNLSNNDIYNFIKNPKVVEYMKSRNLSNSLLPEENEYSNTIFGKTAFDYIKNT